MLRDRAIGDRDNAGSMPPATSGLQLSSGTTWAPPFQTPIHAEVDGEPVRLIQIGDKPGFSPVGLCIGQAGILTEVRLHDVRVRDGAYLPLPFGGVSTRQDFPSAR
jgi:hypothetical protein